ncbi:MAG: DUF58 domain-containing protein [Planctomycetaceae bacterium]
MTERTVTNELLSPRLLGRLERLELASRKIFRGQMKGERRSKRKGQSVEFADFRSYVAGDDLRLIDWNLYARLDHLFLKLFQEEEDLHLHALIDTSESMNFGTPSKLHVAKQIAAALGYVGLCRSDRVRVAALGVAGRSAPVLRGRGGLFRMLDYLGSLASDQQQRANSPTLTEGVKDFLLRDANTGIVVLITDLMDKSGYEAALRMLIGRRMDVFLIHLLSPEELEPPLRGDLRLIDCEDGDQTEITLTRVAIKKYRETVQGFIESARQFCSRRGITYVLARSDTPIESLITDYLQKRGVVR